MNPAALEIIGAALFGIAVIHTFSTKFFEHLAHTQPAHAGVWHLLGEVEVVFGFWARCSKNLVENVWTTAIPKSTAPIISNAAGFIYTLSL